MKNNLISKLKRGMYNGLTVGALGLSLLGVGCGDSPTQPKVYNDPVSSLQGSPLSGVAPLESRVTAGCTADAGIESYKIMLNGNYLTNTNPIDTSISSNNNASLSSECKDRAGKIVTKKIDFTVAQPSFSDTAMVSDSANIVYNATMNVSQAERKTFRNDSLIGTKTITGPTYSDTIFNAPEGNYYFTNNINSNTAKVTKSSYVTLDTSGLQTDTIEGGVIGFNLASRMHSPGINPVHLTNAVPLDTITNVQRNGDSVAITALRNNTGPYSVKFSMKAANGDTGSYVFKGNIHDVPDISGKFQDVKTYNGVRGKIKVQGVSGGNIIPLTTNNSDSIGYLPTDSVGNFSFRVNKRSSSLDSLVLQFREVNAQGDSLGFVRRINIPVRDTDSLLVRGYPFPDSIPADTFITFMDSLGGSIPDTRFDIYGQYILKFGGLQGIEILPSFEGDLYNSQRDSIKNQILDPKNISGIIGRYNIENNQVIIEDQGHYKPDTTVFYGQKFISITPDPGWIIVAPDSNILRQYGASGMTQTFGTGTEYGAVVYLDPWSDSLHINGGIIAREFGHAFIGSGEPEMIPYQTIMNTSSHLRTVGYADKEAGRIIYEPTFMIPAGILPAHVDRLENILGSKFK
ncbi:MAG: hypothetical protein ABSG05_01025 [Candidatus Pacearchaeota archaeon]|jgi:hypothetical protein